MKFPWQKTSRREVFNYIAKYQAFQMDNGLKYSVPSGTDISLVFNISRSRANQYLNNWKELNKNIKNLRFE